MPSARGSLPAVPTRTARDQCCAPCAVQCTSVRCTQRPARARQEAQPRTVCPVQPTAGLSGDRAQLFHHPSSHRRTMGYRAGLNPSASMKPSQALCPRLIPGQPGFLPFQLWGDCTFWGHLWGPCGVPYFCRAALGAGAESVHKRSGQGPAQISPGTLVPASAAW